MRREKKKLFNEDRWQSKEDVYIKGIWCRQGGGNLKMARTKAHAPCPTSIFIARIVIVIILTAEGVCKTFV